MSAIISLKHRDSKTKKPARYWASSEKIFGKRPAGIILLLFKLWHAAFLGPFWHLYPKKGVMELNVCVIYIYTHTKNDVKAGASALQG